MRSWLSDIIDKYFNFLKTEYGFSGPYEYNVAHELECYYLKKDIVIMISYDSVYWASVIKLKRIFSKLYSSEILLNKISYKDQITYDLVKIANVNNVDIHNDKVLEIYANYLKNNSEILSGDISKLIVKNQLIKSILKIFKSIIKIKKK
jgi:hypothetical protein